MSTSIQGEAIPPDFCSFKGVQSSVDNPYDVESSRYGPVTRSFRRHQPRAYASSISLSVSRLSAGEVSKGAPDARQSRKCEIA